MESEEKNNQAKKTNRLIDAENKLMIARGDGGEGVGQKVKGIKRYKFQVVK